MQFATILNYTEYPSYYDQLTAQVSNNYLYVTGRFANKFINDLIPININSFNYTQQSYSSVTYNQTYLLYDLLSKNLKSNITINQLTPNILAIPIYLYNNTLYTSLESLLSLISTDNLNLSISFSIDTSITNLSLSLYDAYINLLTSISNDISIIIEKSEISLTYIGSVTSWTALYNLMLNQSLIISFTNSQTIFIPIQMSGSDVYKLYLTQDISSYNNGGVAQDVFLYPNNNAINIAYARIVVAYDNGSSYFNTASSYSNAFRLTYALGSAEATLINSSPISKGIIMNDIELGISQDPATHLSAQVWDDSTSWTMLGTIVLPQVSSGFITIQRIASVY